LAGTLVEIPEDIYKLQQQLANPGDATHLHYHDNRVVIVIQNVPMDVEKITEPVPLMWYNRHHSAGQKYTRVFLGKQVPKKHPKTGEWMLDLLQNAADQKPSITGIFPRHLEVPHKRQRRW